jgi:hypothetical protein
MPDVAALPTEFARRSSILFVSLSCDGRLKFIEDNAEQPVLCTAERRNDGFHAIVDVEACRQHRDGG